MQNLIQDLPSLIDPADLLLALAYAHRIRKEPVVSDVAYDKYKIHLLHSSHGDGLRRKLGWIRKKGFAPAQIRDLALYLESRRGRV